MTPELETNLVLCCQVVENTGPWKYPALLGVLLLAKFQACDAHDRETLEELRFLDVFLYTRAKIVRCCKGSGHDH